MARDPRKGSKDERRERPRSGRLTDPVPIPRPKSHQPSGPKARKDKAAGKEKKSRGYPPFAVTVDLVVFTINDGALQVLLVERGDKPFAGALALPGGFVQVDEDLADAAYRELVEETGIDRQVGHLEQLRTFGAPGRDPRMRTVSVAYLALTPELPAPVAGTDATAARWVSVADLDGVALAFDHEDILRHGLDRARAKLEYTTLATAFCPPEFTVSQLREVYEAVWGRPIDPRNFHRKATRTEGLLEPTGRHTAGEAGRPAQLYRRGTVTALHPPITRAGS